MQQPTLSGEFLDLLQTELEGQQQQGARPQEEDEWVPLQPLLLQLVSDQLLLALVTLLAQQRYAYGAGWAAQAAAAAADPRLQQLDSTLALDGRHALLLLVCLLAQDLEHAAAGLCAGPAGAGGGQVVRGRRARQAAAVHRYLSQLLPRLLPPEDLPRGASGDLRLRLDKMKVGGCWVSVELVHEVAAAGELGPE